MTLYRAAVCVLAVATFATFVALAHYLGWLLVWLAAGYVVLFVGGSLVGCWLRRVGMRYPRAEDRR
jgi:hypothetical protein